MYSDVIQGEKSKEFEEMSRQLGFSVIYTIKELKNFRIIEAIDYDKTRKLVSTKKVDIILNPHLQEKKDTLHFRNSGLDQVLCAELNKNNVAMAITLNSLNNATEIGRAMQNITLCRKYNVKTLFFSYAKTPYEMKAVHDLQSFLKVLGMTEVEAKNAINYYFK